MRSVTADGSALGARTPGEEQEREHRRRRDGEGLERVDVRQGHGLLLDLPVDQGHRLVRGLEGAGADPLEGPGEAGQPRMLNIGWHLRIAGRPGRFAAFKRILELLDSYGERVWVARRIDIARSWQEQFPA